MCRGEARAYSVALIPPGVIAQPPRLTYFGGHFRCEALHHSRVAKISRDTFVEIVLGGRVREFERVAKLLFFGHESFSDPLSWIRRTGPASASRAFLI